MWRAIICGTAGAQRPCVTQPSLLFAGLAFGESNYLDLWRKLPPDPTDAEVKRNIAITQPVLWLK